MPKSLRILGCRGVPAQYGGFETFADYFSRFMAKKGWNVEVYCQRKGFGKIWEDSWKGVKRINVPSISGRALGSVIFDIRSVIHSLKSKKMIFTLGYNTAILSIFYRIFNIPNIINMDGLEWKREKWNVLQKAWLYLNEKAAILFADKLIADHPVIFKRFSKKVDKNKLTELYYCSKSIKDYKQNVLEKYGLKPRKYSLLVCRLEPENSVLEIISAFSRKKRNNTLAVVGQIDRRKYAYHRKIFDAASSEVKFLGFVPLEQLGSLRKGARLYIHGHTVGGTNPSLVEAMASSSAIIAKDNEFNRWVAGNGALYFKNESECALCFDDLLDNPYKIRLLRKESYLRFLKSFTCSKVLNDYLKFFNKVFQEKYENSKNYK